MYRVHPSNTLACIYTIFYVVYFELHKKYVDLRYKQCLEQGHIFLDVENKINTTSYCQKTKNK